VASDEQQKVYVDPIFATAAMDGFELVGSTGVDDDRPLT
jgi:hypothetical protein